MIAERKRQPASIPSDLTPEQATLGQVVHALGIVAETPGAWGAMPEHARSVLADALLAYPQPVAVVRRIVEERDAATAVWQRLVDMLETKADTFSRADIRKVVRGS